MGLTISDELLREAGLGEDEARVEIACRLFSAGVITFPTATHWAGLTRTQLEQALIDRDLPVVRLTKSSFEQDLKTLSRMGAPGNGCCE
jgi:predicted HTH domain antitoxin